MSHGGLNGVQNTEPFEIQQSRTNNSSKPARQCSSTRKIIHIATHWHSLLVPPSPGCSPQTLCLFKNSPTRLLTLFQEHKKICRAAKQWIFLSPLFSQQCLMCRMISSVPAACADVFNQCIHFPSLRAYRLLEDWISRGANGLWWDVMRQRWQQTPRKLWALDRGSCGTQRALAGP